MFGKFLALFALVAAANAGAILLPETKIETVPITKTKISGPSGEITQEEHLPVISHETTLVEPVAPVVLPEIHEEVLPTELVHEELPLEEDNLKVLLKPTVRVVKPVVHEEPLVRLVKHEEPLVRLVKPIEREETLVRYVKHEEPLVRLVKPIEREETLVRFVKPIEREEALVRFVKPIEREEALVRFVKPIERKEFLVKAVPDTIPFLTSSFRTIPHEGYYY